MENNQTNQSFLLEAIDLTKRYDDGVLALDHINFSVKPGQIYAMLGANGAGKTTTINLFLNFSIWEVLNYGSHTALNSASKVPPLENWEEALSSTQ